MKRIVSHFSRIMVAGIVALLPIGGAVLGIVYLETVLSESWKGNRLPYFPGLGLIAACAIVYATGLLVSTFLGRWLWKVVDGILARLPLLGVLYNTMKQVLGYAESGDAVFKRVVFLRDPELGVEELGLVTNTSGPEQNLVVFVPGSPVPTSGRLVVVPETATRPCQLSVKEALTALVSIGRTDLEPRRKP